MGNNDKTLGMSGGVPAGEAVSHNPMADRDLNWLVHQLEAWPTRIDPDRTTNIQHLMQTAAKHIRATPINTPAPPIEGRDADVERVARSLADNLYAFGDENISDCGEWEDMSDGAREVYRIAARAALQALGERP